MENKREKWVLAAKKADFRALAGEFGLDPVTIRLMVNRGADTPEKIRTFLMSDWRSEYDPHLMKGAEEAAGRLRAAILRKEKILIASDFDVDGIFSGQILWEAIREAGGQARVLAPDRQKEGYGINVGMVERAAQEGVGTIITCDNGIAAVAAITRAKELGLEVIVTDHHECQYLETADGRELLLPPADVIVNPHQPGCRYPFKGLCGAGVVYKVVQLLYELCGFPREKSLAFLEYAGFATVADVMDLRDENRILVKEGLRRLSHTQNPGLKALLEVCGLAGKTITAYHVGFILGPCFNSAGRLDTVEEAFALLQSTPEKAERTALLLKERNEARKELTRQGLAQAMEWVESNTPLPPVLVIPLPGCHESVAGIVAGRVREQTHHPAVVLTRSADGFKGSGRSIENWNMFEGLSACRDLMTRFGGHPMAAGLSLPEENIPELARRLNDHSGLKEEDFVPVVRIDVPMPLQYITKDLVKEFSVLEPFGKGNPRPLFAEKNFRVLQAAVLGKNRSLVKMLVENEAGIRMDALWFGQADDFGRFISDAFGAAALEALFRRQGGDIRLALVYYPEINEYMGQENLQIIVEHMKPAPSA